MVKTVGILLNDEFDLAVAAKRNSAGLIVGGLQVGASANQQQTILLIANKGEVKNSPLRGVGLNNFLLDDSSADELLQEVNSEFTADGMRVYHAEYSDGKLQVEAQYEQGNTFK